MRPIEDQEICDGLIHSLIQTAAKPIVTLTQVRRDSVNILNENELKMSLGRLWRACRIYRCAVNSGKEVVYWTPATSPAVATSGLIPEMPPETEMPSEFANRAQTTAPRVDVKLSMDETERAEYERICSNRGQLVPISATAALPMRPLASGKYGNLRRHGVTATVAAVMFANRDVRMSVDAVALLCPKNTRVDVSRVLSQLSTLNPTKDYFRKHGHGRGDVKYQWNEIYCYPFSSRMESDGESIDHRNAAQGVKDTQPLDHIPAEQLTETETEKEIARFMAQTYPKEDPIPESDVELEEAAPDEEASEEEAAPDEDGSEDEEESEEADADEDEDDDSEPFNPYPKNWVPPHSVVGDRTVPLPSPTPVPQQTAQGEKILSIPDAAFEASYDMNGQLTLVLDGTPVRLSTKQTEALICLIGPHFLAQKTKRYFRK